MKYAVLLATDLSSKTHLHRLQTCRNLPFVFAMRHHVLILLPVVLVRAVSSTPFIDYESLPNETIFPGPWETYIKAPVNKSYITPARIWKTRGNVTDSGFFYSGVDDGHHEPGKGILIGAGGVLTLEFDENIAGR